MLISALPAKTVSARSLGNGMTIPSCLHCVSIVRSCVLSRSPRFSMKWQCLPVARMSSLVVWLSKNSFACLLIATAASPSMRNSCGAPCIPNHISVTALTHVGVSASGTACHLVHRQIMWKMFFFVVPPWW